MPGGKLVYDLFKNWLKVRFVSLVNLIADQEVVTELLVHHCTPDRICHELNMILHNREVYQRISEGYDEVARRLGQPGAPQRAAQSIVAQVTAKKR